jgi:hypothetical protein
MFIERECVNVYIIVEDFKYVYNELHKITMYELLDIGRISNLRMSLNLNNLEVLNDSRRLPSKFVRTLEDCNFNILIVDFVKLSLLDMNDVVNNNIKIFFISLTLVSGFEEFVSGLLFNNI